MTSTQYYRLKTSKKVGFVFSKLGVVVAILGAAVGAFFASGVEMPTFESRLGFSAGILLIGGVSIIAIMGRLKTLFKIKSIGWIVTFLIIWSFSHVITLLVYTLGFISIPLLIDDIIIMPSWNSYIANTQVE